MGIRNIKAIPLTFFMDNNSCYNHRQSIIFMVDHYMRFIFDHNLDILFTTSLVLFISLGTAESHNQKLKLTILN